MASTMALYCARVQPWMSTAPLGQAATQAPQPTQFAGVTTARLISTPFSINVFCSMAPSYSQAATQAGSPPLHFSGLTYATKGGSSTRPLPSRELTLAAAAEAADSDSW